MIGSLCFWASKLYPQTVFTQPLRSLPQISGCPAFSAAFFDLGYSRSFPRLEGPWLVGDDILLSSIGIIISQYKDPYEPTSIFQGFDRCSFFMESYPGGGFLTIILVFEPYKRRPFSSRSNGHLSSRCTYIHCIFFPPECLMKRCNLTCNSCWVETTNYNYRN